MHLFQLLAKPRFRDSAWNVTRPAPNRRVTSEAVLSFEQSSTTSICICSDRLLQPVLSSLAKNHPLKSRTECKNLFKPRKGQPTQRADNEANCLGGAILF